MIRPTIVALIREVAEDNTSGAVELTKKATQALLHFSDETRAQDLSQFLSELMTAGRELIQAQPSMAPLFNLVNSVLSSLDTAEKVDEARRIVKAAASTFAEDLDASGDKIAKQALPLISDGATIMTHSRSSTVLRALSLAKERGRNFAILCTESRPIFEGRELARQLAQQGIEVTLVTDAAVAHSMNQVDLVMVGADSISSRGLVNKMGTHALALAANAHAVPFYALCGIEKFLPSDCPHMEIELKDPREVWEDSPGGVTVLNYYFDLTPLEFVSAVVTEKGLLGRASVLKMLSQLRTHKLLI
jgi:translation initiation factor eIF-2B subunit delta